MNPNTSMQIYKLASHAVFAGGGVAARAPLGRFVFFYSLNNNNNLEERESSEGRLSNRPLSRPRRRQILGSAPVCKNKINSLKIIVT